jgi:hypothetical protein
MRKLQAGEIGRLFEVRTDYPLVGAVLTLEVRPIRGDTPPREIPHFAARAAPNLTTAFKFTEAGDFPKPGRFRVQLIAVWSADATYPNGRRFKSTTTQIEVLENT